MTVHRPIPVTPGSLFFHPELPIHANRVSESFQLLEHTHDFVEICAVAEGEGEHYIGGTHFKVAKGDLFYIPVGVSHVFRPRSADPGRRLIVYNCIFTRSCLDTILKMFPLEKEMERYYEGLEEENRWVSLHDHSGESQRILHRLQLETAGAMPGYSASLFNGLVELLVLIFRRRSGLVRAETPAPGDGLRELLARIDGECALPVRAEELAGALGISARQLQRRVREASGMSLTEYVQDARIRESCRLLSRSEDPVGAVAAAVGYQDLKFFRRLFKSKTGTTPGEYRRRSRKSEAGM